MPAVAINYVAGVDQAIAILAANQVLAAQVIGQLATAGEQAAGMRNLVNYLLVTPNATTLQYVDTYQVNQINVLRDDRRLYPARAAAWENALLAGMTAQAPLMTHVRANFPHLLDLRNHMFAHDGNNAPNFAVPMGFIAQVIAQNAAQLGETLHRLDAVLLAAPHDHDANLPFGNRAGGLRGHFKKHVLGLQGNTDRVEPLHWIANLNLVPARLEYQHFGVAPRIWVVQEVFQAGNRSAGDKVKDGPRMILLMRYGALGGADNVAQQFENDYHAYISQRFDAPTGKYLYFYGAQVNINAYQGDTFIVAGFENGRFDFSSGYKPYEFRRRAGEVAGRIRSSTLGYLTTHADHRTVATPQTRPGDAEQDQHLDSEARAAAAPVDTHELPKPRVRTPFAIVQVGRNSGSARALTRAEVAQLQRTIGNAAVAQMSAKVAPCPNQTDLPDRLKAGVEALSGLAMDDVRVTYASSAPAKVGAAAFAQGSQIHLGPGQERHLAHEAWHVAQQKQGRVAATTQFGGAAINDDPALEQEADMMGARQPHPGPRRAPPRHRRPASPRRLPALSRAYS